MLDDRSLAAVRAMLARDVAAHCVLSARLDAARSLKQRLLGGRVMTSEADALGELPSATYVGGTVMPCGVGPAARADAAAVGAWLAAQPRACSSIVGDVGNVLSLWMEAERGWGEPRLLRDCQPLLATRTAPSAPPDPRVRAARPDELDLVVPAAAAMFAEELEASPFERDGGAGFRARLSALIDARRVLVRIDDGEVLYKAEIGSVTADATQIQGVWVRPDLRGAGLGTAAMSATLMYALRLAPLATLYVNDFNDVARRVYSRLGMSRVGTFATVLF